ncbi:sensor histidine kinase [Streptomyces prunicolor]|uniref:sensor histidine kinase n=1 Tax=Streptomyces prunicolor TaxID=67348 RepID=UPI003721A69D
MRAAGRGWWGRKSTPGKVETYTRWTFHFFALLEIAAIGLVAAGANGSQHGVWVFVLVCAHALFGVVVTARALDWTRGRREQPVRLLAAHGVVTALTAITALWLLGSGSDTLSSAAATVFVGVLTFGPGTIALGVRDRRWVFSLVAGAAAGTAVLALPLGVSGEAALGLAVAVFIGAGSIVFTAAFSVWLLDAVYELDEARETRARLAVAEERLRFGRDLHDVMGRNLSVIALKSELAVQLARRGRAEAVEQMIEVQRIARESQREVRDVVRGYREADLRLELAGAQGVLAAAGIECEVTGDAAGLPVEVQSALGWVVREATTNVLRHGDAGRCVVGVRVMEGRVVLTVENDGAKVADGGGAALTGENGGSGLIGLRERLTAVSGELEAGTVGEDRFRVVATVPLPDVTGAVA